MYCVLARFPSNAVVFNWSFPFTYPETAHTISISNEEKRRKSANR